MADYNDRLMNLKSEEKDAISEIQQFLKSLYLGDRSTMRGDSYARFLRKCFQRFSDYLVGIDAYYLSRNENTIASLAEYKNWYSTDSRSKDDSNCYFVNEAVIKSEFVEKIAGVAARSAIDALLKFSTNTISGLDRDNICQIAIDDAFNVAQEYTDVSRSYLNDASTVKQIDLLDRIESTAKIDFDYVAGMLDLTNDHVCKFLPCLLTAFVCSGARRDFFSRGTTGIAEIFGERSDELPRKDRRVAQIKRLGNTFSLKGSKFKFKKTLGAETKRYIVNRNKANLDVLFATHVFKALSAILFDTAQDMARKAEDAAEAADMAEKARDVVSKIDLKSCYALLLNFVDPDSPELKNILSDTNWKHPKCNETLLHNFRFETENFIF